VEDDSQSNPSETTEEDELTMAVENENGSIIKNELQEILVAEFPTNIQTFFDTLYSNDSNFTKKFHSKTNHRDVTIEKWENHPHNGIFRNITFKSPTGAPIGPSTTRVDETQRYELSKTKFILETVSVMSDVPYADCFRIEGKHELVSLDEEKCKYVIYAGVHFTKKTLFEGKIRSQSMKQMKESFQTWIALATEEFQQLKSPKDELSSHLGKQRSQDSEPEELSPRPSTISKEKQFLTLQTLTNLPISTVALFILSFLVLFLYIQVVKLMNRVSDLEEKLFGAKP